MEKNKPMSYSDLRMNIAKEAWSIWCPTRPLPAIPAEFFNIADYAIKTIHQNFDKMVSETIKQRLEKLLP
jgi:hypothetical protein